MSHHHHRCGVYYWTPGSSRYDGSSRNYLPQLGVKAHTQIISSTSRTVLNQKFINTKSNALDEIRYTFPLYDGVSVVGFTCRVNDRVIRGVVKEKEKAKKDYKDAVRRGETAGLLEQLPDAADVFTTTVGNILPGAHIDVEITYLGELKHDAEVDGIRFTIPTHIAPRYGATQFPVAPGAGHVFGKGGIEITVDATVAEGTFIKSIRSPSHPIEVYMGTTSQAPNADPQHHVASASLSLEAAELDKDFVLQVVAKDTGTPRAILETHPTLPGYRALMATLVPKFSLPSERPEVVFVVDRSGSMSGSKIKTTADALRVFVKSLPVGVKFNICSFGSNHNFLFDKSKAYSQDSLDQAIRLLQHFDATYGGTEMLEPVKETIKRRYKDLPLEILLLTDGEIWDQQGLFNHLNEEINEKKQPIRVFTLGIGNEVSHSLIEGVARAGNGFSQAVAVGEKLEGKVVRMLKGALSPHVTGYTLEVKYENDEKGAEDDGFEIIESVEDSLNVRLDELMIDDEEKSGSKTSHKKPISLFDDSVDLDKTEAKPEDDTTGESRFSHLPSLETPKLLQAPSAIPPLYPFNRTSVYLLLSPFASQATPKSVVLRATSKHGPLELEIPVSALKEPGETIHQLAAKKAVTELEEGRGWLSVAKYQGSGKLLKDHYESRYDEMVEREGVRLGVQFQVGGKWCSFVALEESGERGECESDRAFDSGPTSASRSGKSSTFTTGRRGKSKRNQRLATPSHSSSTLQAPALIPVPYIDDAALAQYESEMSSAACIPLPDEGDAYLNGCTDPSPTRSLPSMYPPSPNNGAGLSKRRGAVSRQTARKCTGDRAPRKQLASKAARKSAASDLAVTRRTPPTARRSARGKAPRRAGEPMSDHAPLEVLPKKRGRPSRGQSVQSARKSARLASTPAAPDTKELESKYAPSSAPALALAPASVTIRPPGPVGQDQAGRNIMTRSMSASTPANSNLGTMDTYAPVYETNQLYSRLASVYTDHGSPAGPRGGPMSLSMSLHASRPQAAIQSSLPPPPPPPGAPSNSQLHSMGRYAPTQNFASYSSDVPSMMTLCRAVPTAPVPAPVAVPQMPEEIVAALISLQTFSGSFPSSPELWAIIGTTEAALNEGAKKAGLRRRTDVLVTLIVVLFFERKLRDLEESWELVVEKARGWVEGQIGDMAGGKEEKVAGGFVG